MYMLHLLLRTWNKRFFKNFNLKEKFLKLAWYICQSFWNVGNSSNQYLRVSPKIRTEKAQFFFNLGILQTVFQK